MTFFERLEELRKSVGISQGKLEKELGISNGSVSKWRTSTPTLKTMQKLADYFSVSVDYLAYGEESGKNSGYYINEETAAIAQSIYENKELRLLFDAAKDSAPEDLGTVHSMLLALKRKEQGNVD